MDLKDYIELGITIGGWCIMIGVYTQKIKNNEAQINALKEQHDKDISAINSRQNVTDTILQSINNTLASLDAKVDLIIQGKINTQIGDAKK